MLFTIFQEIHQSSDIYLGVFTCVISFYQLRVGSFISLALGIYVKPLFSCEWLYFKLSLIKHLKTGISFLL